MTKIVAKIIVWFVCWLAVGFIVSLSLYGGTKKTEDDAMISVGMGFGVTTLGAAFVWAMITLGW